MQAQAMKRLLGPRLWRLALKLERYWGHYESLLTETWPLLHVYVGQSNPRVLVYCTKNALLQRWLFDDAFPSTWIGLARYGLPTPQYLEEIRLHTARYRLPLMFVGDLDPLDLTVFSILRKAMPAHYLGIDDGWVALADAHRRPRRAVQSVMFKMGAQESEHWSIARQLLPDLEQLVGPRCLSLLESGAKLEIEGACETGTYGKKFPALIARYLHRKALRLTAR
jgi:hypothetical protein